MLIGALHGRHSAQADDKHCIGLAAEYRQRFRTAFGCSRCQDLRDQGYGSRGDKPCAELASRSVMILLDVLDGQDADGLGKQEIER
jgi:hypothetical protein